MHSFFFPPHCLVRPQPACTRHLSTRTAPFNFVLLTRLDCVLSPPYRMVVGRTFAIYPGMWIWLENQCDLLTFVMREPAHEGIFTFGPRPVAEFSGQDLGVFRMFHPQLNPRDDFIPEADAAGMYYLISSTLM